MVEVVNTTLMDAKEKLGLSVFKRKELVALVVCFVAFLVGIPNLMQVWANCTKHIARIL